jgi:hypothetical protein
MATVGNLNINVNARTASFSKKMKGVRATVGRLAKGFGRIAGKVLKFAAILGGIAVAAIIALTKKGLAAVDTMAKLAQTIGTSVESIQVLRHMATLGGVSIEKMDKSMSKMSKNIGESAMGIGTANDALAELGLKATDLEKMSPDVMFGVIADELNKVGSTARKASLAYDIFGRAGQELLVTMKEGSAGIDAMRDKLNSLGVIIGDEQAQMVEKANDAWADIGLVWKGLQNQLAVQFAPILTEIANRIVQFIKDSGGMGAIAEHIAKAFFYAGSGVLDTIKIIQIGWLGLKTAVIQVTADIVKAMAWAAEKAEKAWNWIKGTHEKAISWTDEAISWSAGALADASGGLGLEGMEKELRFWEEGAAKAAATGANNAAAIFNQTIDHSVSDFLKSMGGNLEDQAGDAATKLLEKLSEGFSSGKVDTTFESLKDKFMGEGFDLSGKSEIELTTPDFKGVAESLSTAIGSMKIEGDSQSRIAAQSLSIEKEQLKTSKDTLDAIRNGGALT